MAKYVFVVYTEPFEGRDDEYNDWYDNQHVADVEALEGVISARRFKLAEMDPPQDGHPPYLALYEIETDDISKIPAAIRSGVLDGSMPLSDALDRSKNVTAYYEAIR